MNFWTKNLALLVMPHRMMQPTCVARSFPGLSEVSVG